MTTTFRRWAIAFFILLSGTAAWAEGNADYGASHAAMTMPMPAEAGAAVSHSFEIIPNWHPLFVHFTIALLLVASGLFVVGRFAPAQASWRAGCLLAARWNLWLGTLITFGTVLAGWYAFNSVNHDDVSHLVMLTHRGWALSTVAAFTVLAIWSVAARKKEPPVLLVLGLLLASMALGITGYYGGELVYRHGLGVLSALPADNQGHQHHEHDHAH